MKRLLLAGREAHDLGTEPCNLDIDGRAVREGIRAETGAVYYASNYRSLTKHGYTVPKENEYLEDLLE